MDAIQPYDDVRPFFRPEAEGRGRIYTPFCPGLFGPVTSDVPFAGPCVVGRSPGVVCRTPGLTLEHFRCVFLVRYPFTQSFMFEDCTAPQKKDAVLLEHHARPRTVRSLPHLVFFDSGLHISSQDELCLILQKTGVLLLHPPLSSSQLPALLAVREEY